MTYTPGTLYNAIRCERALNGDFMRSPSSSDNTWVHALHNSFGLDLELSVNSLATGREAVCADTLRYTGPERVKIS